MFQRHFYRRQQQPLEPGPVLSQGEEERLRVRRKLESLEMELRAAELVTAAPPRPAARRQSAEPAAAVSRSPSRLQEEEEDCVMCVREKKLEQPGPRVPARASRSRAQPVHRSKSDAADCLAPPSDGGRRGGSGLGAKIIKRSMSFNRIFNSSMLSRSKEYRL